MEFSVILHILIYSSCVTCYLFSRQAFTLTRHGFDTTSEIFGNVYNYWSQLPNGTFDLTRRNSMHITSPKFVPMSGSRSGAIIEPNRTALIIIDMQNYFLHPLLSPHATAGRKAVQQIVNMINGFRNSSMKVLWVQWGLTDHDLLTIPPAFISPYSANQSNRANESLGSDMGTIDENNKTIELGQALMRGSWNAEPYGVLQRMKDEGLTAGTDLVFNKNRLSGLWGRQTPLGIWLQENELTTLFFGGVNADQCVWSTLVDSFFKGYDVVYVQDISATTSPEYATQMVLYNANIYGFISNSSAILNALK